MRRQNRLRWVLAVAGIGLAGACGFSFQSASQVVDQRILAIASTPAQLTPATVGANLRVNALIVDPTTTNPLNFTVRLCLVPGGSDGIVASSGRDRAAGGGGSNGNQESLANLEGLQRCPDDAGIVAQGPQPLGDVAVNIPLSALTALLGVALPDGGFPSRGDGGFSFPMDGGGLPFDGGSPADGGGLSGDAGGSPTDGGSPVDGGSMSSPDAGAGLPPEVLAAAQALFASPIPVDLQIEFLTVNGNALQYAIKDVPLTGTLPPGDAPNQNPQLQGLTFDGMPWVDGTPLSITLASCAQKETSGRFSFNGTATCEHTIVPQYDPAQSESFHTVAADGGWVDNRERLSFAWFTTQGTFSPTTTSQALSGEATPDVQSNGIWSEPSSATGSSATFWVVVRDGRGGSSWVQRQLNFQ
jgi:hypothetical protein